MQKKIIAAAIALFISVFTFAQSPTKPETPRNYKPKAKELIPMQDSLTNKQVFPILGKYEIADQKGNISAIYITQDADNKGMVWISGLRQGKFKAYFKASPVIYKIPAQQALINDKEEDIVSSDPSIEKKAKKIGNSIEEGTMIFDKEANKIYINFGNKFNENNPGYVFSDANAVTTEVADSTDVKKPAKKIIKPAIKGITYKGAKIIENVSPVQ